MLPAGSTVYADVREAPDEAVGSADSRVSDPPARPPSWQRTHQSPAKAASNRRHRCDPPQVTRCRGARTPSPLRRTASHASTATFGLGHRCYCTAVRFRSGNQSSSLPRPRCRVHDPRRACLRHCVEGGPAIRSRLSPDRGFSESVVASRFVLSAWSRRLNTELTVSVVCSVTMAA